MHETSAQGWCTGMTQRDGTGREVGGGIGMGAHINPWLIHVNVWQKPLRYCKVISLQLIKTNEKKKKSLETVFVYVMKENTIQNKLCLNTCDQRMGKCLYATGILLLSRTVWTEQKGFGMIYYLKLG